MEDHRTLDGLRRIVCRMSSDPVLQQDLKQEGLVHLWRISKRKPVRTRSWYLQSCRFHLQHWLASGRSVDSPKRARGDRRISLDGADNEAILGDTNGELFEAVSFQDVVSTLAM